MRLRTHPASFRQTSGDDGLTAFWWGPTGYPEIGQTVRVTEPFELTELRVGIHRASSLAGWRTASFDEIAWTHDTLWTGTVPGVRIRVTIWPVEGRGGSTLDVAGIPAITEQYVTADAPVIGGLWASPESVRMRLATPVQLGAGHHLVSLGIDDIGRDPNVFNFYVLGSRYGFTDRTGFDRQGPALPCTYRVTPERYPEGRLYYRDFSARSKPTPLANATTVFREHRAKVLASSLNDCGEEGSMDYMLPGDLELVMIGR